MVLNSPRLGGPLQSFIMDTVCHSFCQLGTNMNVPWKKSQIIAAIRLACRHVYADEGGPSPLWAVPYGPVDLGWIRKITEFEPGIKSTSNTPIVFASA